MAALKNMTVTGKIDQLAPVAPEQMAAMAAYEDPFGHICWGVIRHNSISARAEYIWATPNRDEFLMTCDEGEYKGSPFCAFPVDFTHLDPDTAHDLFRVFEQRVIDGEFIAAKERIALQATLNEASAAGENPDTPAPEPEKRKSRRL